ncbi:MAG: hypothetical protein RQ751_04775 [Longimicrobiales bacterium]|nr:hypothetical protein [Longimicrobiales bacterium]
MNRRAFLFTLPAAALVGVALPGRLRARLRGVEEHPDPRPGIDASKVVSAEQLRSEGFDDEVIALYDGIREMPEIADGLACYCGCMWGGTRSLLECYWDDGMARGCLICQGEARLAYGRWKQGQSLRRIRRAIDARFG